MAEVRFKTIKEQLAEPSTKESVTFRSKIDKDDVIAIRKIAFLNHTSPSEVVRVIIRMFIEDYRKIQSEVDEEIKV